MNTERRNVEARPTRTDLVDGVEHDQKDGTLGIMRWIIDDRDICVR